MTEAPTVKELTSLSDVAKKDNFGVKQRRVTACTVDQVAEVSRKE